MSMIILHYRATGTEFIAAQDASEIVDVRQHAPKISGSTIVYADGRTISVQEQALDVRLALHSE